MLKLKNIVKAYNSQVILNNISITLPNKGLVSLIGTSGSGKSTLLNLIGGLDKPDQGNIIVNNKDITKFNSKELDWYRSKYVGFIFQSYNLIEYLSVKDNLSLINSNNTYILRKLDIYDLRNKKVSLLSGGEKQRVAIARAILKNPKILLCDEPTGALDSKNSSQVLKILKRLSKDRLVIVITHNKDLARKYSDNIIHIKDGIISDNLEVNDKSDKMIVDKHRKINIFKIVYSHLKNKHKRNLLISLSFAIGLIALGLVLSINKGFKNSIDYEEKNY
ncbi:MAG: ABC transporter ATP-binding protein, partial [Bacilli bacterium]|nr:ABC transporter ATP-binding protein [Bacilli bacterium]